MDCIERGCILVWLGKKIGKVNTVIAHSGSGFFRGYVYANGIAIHLITNTIVIRVDIRKAKTWIIVVT